MTALFTSSVVLFKKSLLVHIWHRAFSDHRVRNFSLYAILNSWKLILRFIFEWAFYIYSNRTNVHILIFSERSHMKWEINIVYIYVAWYKFNVCRNATLEIWSKSRITVFQKWKFCYDKLSGQKSPQLAVE